MQKEPVTADDLRTSVRSRTTDSESPFRRIAELGEGGMAKVHLAVTRGRSGFNKLVVLKTLRSNLSIDPDFVAMFLHEARLAARLNHPNVVQTYEIIEDMGSPVIVMEYLDGEPLSHILLRASQGRPLPLAMHLRIVCDTLAGLHYAHELADFDGTALALVHRDVSPQNVLVTFEGQVKILDFGIAKAGIAAPSQTETGVLKGKVRYMAPEQMEGSAIDRRADIFGAGAMLWEALAGQIIWSGVSDMAVMRRVISGEIPTPRTFNPDVPERLEAICMRAMSFDPADRFDTARQFELELESALAELGDTVRQRTIGQFVADLFADTRAQLKNVIEDQIGGAAILSSGPIELRGAASSPAMRVASDVAAHAKDPPVPAMAAPVVTNRWKPLLLVLFGVILGAGALTWTSARTAGVARPAPTTVAQPVAAALPISLYLSATPPQARLFFDDGELASNPQAVSAPPDPSHHRVRAEAPGYATQTADVTLDKNASVSIALEPSPPAEPLPAPKSTPPPRAKASMPTNRAPPAVAASSAPNCTQPYYFDDGIKKIRAECL